MSLQRLSVDNFRNCVIRNVSGNFGYVGFINGKYMGFRNIKTVQELMANGFIHLTIGDDDSDFIKILAESFEDTATINLKTDSTIKIDNDKEV